MNKLIAIHDLLTTATVAPAAIKTRRHTPHSEALIGVGSDHTASLVIDDEGVDELHELLKEELRDCTFEQAISIARTDGRRICREGWFNQWLEVTTFMDSNKKVHPLILMHHERWADPKTWSPNQIDILSNDWVVIEKAR